MMAESHESWRLYQSSHSDVSVKLRKFAKAKTAEDLEKLWAPRLAGTSDISIPLCEPNAEGQAVLERAWLDSTYREFWDGPKSGEALLGDRRKSDSQEAEDRASHDSVLSPNKKGLQKIMTSFRKVLNLCHKGPQISAPGGVSLDSLAASGGLHSVQKLRKDGSLGSDDAEFTYPTSERSFGRRKSLKGSKDSFSSGTFDLCSLTSGSWDFSPKVGSSILKARAPKPPLIPSSPSQPLTPRSSMGGGRTLPGGEKRPIRFRVVKSVDASRSGSRLAEEDLSSLASRLSQRRPPPLMTGESSDSSSHSDLNGAIRDVLLRGYPKGKSNSPTGAKNQTGGMFRESSSLMRTRSGPMDLSSGPMGGDIVGRRNGIGGGGLRRADFGSADVGSMMSGVNVGGNSGPSAGGLRRADYGSGDVGTMMRNMGIEKQMSGSGIGSRLSNGGRRSPLYRDLSLDPKLLDSMLESPTSDDKSESTTPKERFNRRPMPSPSYTITKGLTERLREKQHSQQQSTQV